MYFFPKNYNFAKTFIKTYQSIYLNKKSELESKNI